MKVNVKVNVKRLHPDAKLPFKKYDSDFCYDVIAVSEEEVAPNVWKYGLGFSLQLVRYSNSLKFSFDIRPRSSVWKTGMVLSNSVGTVDEHYTGEVSVVFYHVLPDMPRYKVGERIAQLKLGWTEGLQFEFVDELNETDRGSNGYGSTGR